MTFSPQNFVDKQGPVISAAFLNGLDVTVNFVLAGATTVAEAQAALGIPSSGIPVPVPVALGGTASIAGVGTVVNGLGDAGTTNVYVVSVTPGALGTPGALVAGQILAFQADNTNTGASTLAAGGTPAVAVVSQFGNPLTGSEILAGGITLVRYTGTVWQIINQASPFNASPAELATSLTINPNFIFGNVLRYGVVANDPSKANANATILQKLWNPLTANGPTGNFFFPNTTGVDVYYLGAVYTQIRGGVNIDLGGSTLNFTGTYVVSFNGAPFWACVRDVKIANGNVVVNYSAPINTGAGAFLQVGSRFNSSIPWAQYTTGILDQDNLFANGLPLQGNCTISDLRVSTNNPGALMIVSTGDISNTTFKSIWLDGGGVAAGGLDYEFGFASTNGQPGVASAWTSSHAQNLVMRDIHVSNMGSTTGAQTISVEGVGARGAWSVLFDGIYVNGSDQAVAVGTGEAGYFRPWVRDTSGPLSKPFAVFRDINVLNSTGGIAAQGAVNLTSGQYISPAINALPAPQIYQAQTDLMSFFIDGFSINSANPISILGASVYDIRNGSAVGNPGSSSGGIFITDEAIRGNVENVSIAGIAAQGIRANVSGTSIWPTPRGKVLEVSRCKITGCLSVGIGLQHILQANIHHNQIGASPLLDVAAETVQTEAVDVGLNCTGVLVDSNTCEVAAGGTIYSIIGTGGNCNIRNPLGNVGGNIVSSGNWDVDDIANATGTQLASKTSTVNTIGKYAGKQCQDSSIGGVTFIAQGGLPTSSWVPTCAGCTGAPSTVVPS